MAFTNYIQQIKGTNNTTYDLVDSSASHFVKGTQTAATNVWTGALPDGVTAYYDGLSIDYFLPYAGNSTAATLNLGSKGAKPVYVGNGTGGVTTHFPQYSVIHLTYIVNSSLNSGNGCWKVTGYYDSNTYTSAYCSTAAATAAKAASMSGYAATANRYVMVTMTAANSAASAITLNINGTGAKPIYINGSASSTSNYTLPAGSYLVYYDGTNYYFRTDGKITGDVTGSASRLLYGECSTAAATAAKTITVDSSFELVTGATVAVKFTYTNTASSPTLNVNSTGAKSLMRYGNTYAGTAVATAWNAGSVLSLLYDGTYWQIMDWQNDSNVTQNHKTSDTNYNMALANYTSTSGGTSTICHSSKIKGNPSTGRVTTEDLSSSDIATFVDSLTYSQINVVDYVVEQGVSGNWSWRKWNSGIGECWLQYNPGSYTCGTTRGSLYSGGNLTLTYPITFVSYPTVTGNVSLGTDAYVVWLQFNALGTTTAQCRIVSSGSVAANSNYLISVQVIGRWK